MPTPPYFPSAELVARSWINSHDFEFDCDVRLPSVSNPATSGWVNEGFIQINGVIGGSVDRYTGTQSAIVQLESWAFTPGSGFPPWWMASHNIEQVIRSGNTLAISYQHVSMPDDFYGVRLMEANAMGTARKRNGDLGNYACFIIELEIVWVPLTVVTSPPDNNDPLPGPDLPNLVYEFTNSMVWTVTHNLGYYPTLSILDEDENEMDAAVHHQNVNTFTVQFAQPSSGSVVVSR